MVDIIKKSMTKGGKDFDPRSTLPPLQYVKMLDQFMDDYVKNEIQNDQLEHEKKKYITFPQYTQDLLVRQFGIPAIAHKSIVSLYFGVRDHETQEYGSILGKIVGLSVPPFKKE